MISRTPSLLPYTCPSSRHESYEIHLRNGAELSVEFLTTVPSILLVYELVSQASDQTCCAVLCENLRFIVLGSQDQAFVMNLG